MILAYRTRGLSFRWDLLLATLNDVDRRWLTASICLILLSNVGRALRWQVMLRPFGHPLGVWRLTSDTAIGFTAAVVLGRVGEVVRPYLIAVKEGVPATSQFAAWVLERIFDLLMALLLFAFALTRVQASGIQVGPKLAWVLAFGGSIVGLACVSILAVLLSFRHFAEPARRRLVAFLRFLPEARFRKMEKLIFAFVQGVESTRSDGALLAVFLYSLLEWVLIAACYWCLAQAFAGLIDLNLVDVLIFMGFVSFGSVIQIPGIGGGIQMASVLVLTELFGVRLELATSFALLIWILSFVVVVPVGLGLAVKEGLDWHSLRKIGQEAAQ